MTTSMQRYTLRLTSELEELVEARRVELNNDPLHLAYQADDITTAYALTHIIVTGALNVRRGHAELQNISGATTRTIKATINPAFHLIFAELATEYDLSIHATLRALIVAGASS